MALMQVSRANPGDEIALRAGAKWEDAERGTIDYTYFSSESMNRGILRNNPSRESKYVVCFAEVASHLDFNDLGNLDDIACDWIPIPDHIVVEVLRQRAATPTDKGFGDWVRGLVPKKFREDAPQRIVGLPVPQEDQGEPNRYQEREPSVEYGEDVIVHPGSDLVPSDQIVDLPAPIEQEQVEEYEDALMEREPTPGDRVEEDWIEGEFTEITDDVDYPTKPQLALPEGHVPTIEETPEQRKSRKNRLKDALRVAGDYTLDTLDQAGKLTGDIRRKTGDVVSSKEVDAGGRFGGRLLKRAGQYGSSMLLSTLRASDTGKLMRLARVQPGQNVMFVADEGVHGIERGDRGTVRMGPRGKDKVVYIPDTGEIKYPSQWTLVSLVGMIQDPNIGTHNLGLGLYGEQMRYNIGSGRHQMIMPRDQGYGGPGYIDDRPIRIGPNWVGTMKQWLALSNEDKIKFGGGPEIVGAREGTALRRAFNQQHFGFERLDPRSDQRTYRIDGQEGLSLTQDHIEALYKLAGQSQVGIYSGDEDDDELGQALSLPRGAGKGSKVVFNTRTDDEGEKYIEVVIPYGRLPSELQASHYKRKGIVIKTSKAASILWTREMDELANLKADLGAVESKKPSEIEVRYVSSGSQPMRGDTVMQRMIDLKRKQQQGEQLTEEEEVQIIKPVKTTYFEPKTMYEQLVEEGVLTLPTDENKAPY